VQEGFQYPMRLLSGVALSLVGLLVLTVAFQVEILPHTHTHTHTHTYTHTHTNTHTHTHTHSKTLQYKPYALAVRGGIFAGRAASHDSGLPLKNKYKKLISYMPAMGWLRLVGSFKS